MAIAVSFRSYFVRGLAVLLPTIVTIWVFAWGYNFIQENISIYINMALVRLTMIVKGIDWNNEEARKVFENFWVHGWGSIAGFIIAVAGVCIVGIALASVVGKAAWKMIEKFIMNTPLLKQVYPYIKQVTDFLFTQEEQKKLFSGVVAVEYPRKGLWTMGFVTGSGIKHLNETVGDDIITIFMPASPTPFTGYIALVPRKDVIELNIAIDDALRFLVSGGVIAPIDKPSLKAENITQ